MFIDEPVMRDIWQATQADRALQKLDEEDGAYLAGLLRDAFSAHRAGDAATPALAAFSQLTMTLIAAAVRHAITLKPKDAGAHDRAVQTHAAGKSRRARRCAVTGCCSNTGSALIFREPLSQNVCVAHALTHSLLDASQAREERLPQRRSRP